MKKLFAISLGLLIILSAVPFSANALSLNDSIRPGLASIRGVFTDGDVVGVTDNFINVRSGAGLSSSVLGTVSVGDIGVVAGGPINSNGYAWYNVVWKENLTGWVAGRYLKKITNDNGAVDWAIYISCGFGHGLAQAYNQWVQDYSFSTHPYYLRYDCDVRTFTRYSRRLSMMDGDSGGSSAGLNSLTSVSGSEATSTPAGCDYDGSGQLDSVDLGKLIDYLFQGGSIPPGTTGDVNSDGNTDAVDLNVFVDYLFYNAPLPAGCAAAQPPTVDLKADGSDGPITIPYGTATMLSWISTNTNSCYGSRLGSGAWGGVLPTSGAQGSGNLISDTVFTLSCQNSAGVTAVDSVMVNVASNQPPLITSFWGPDTIVEDSFGTWNATAIDPEGGQLTYTFDWGDNNPASTTVISNATSGASVSAWHYYSNPGVYPITLTVQDPSLAFDSSVVWVSVTASGSSTTNQAPVINYFSGNSSGTAGEAFPFFGKATDPDGDFLEYGFSFGDGSPTQYFSNIPSGQEVYTTHVYGWPGTYTAWFLVNDGNASTSASRTVIVSSSTSANTSNTVSPNPASKSLKTSTRLPVGASVYDSLQRQIYDVYRQLQLIKSKLRY